MTRFIIAILKRLLVSVTMLVSIIAIGTVYGHFFGPSKISYAGTIMLVAWPWALPQLFVVVSVVWFVVQRIKHLRQHGSRPAS